MNKLRSRRLLRFWCRPVPARDRGGVMLGAVLAMVVAGVLGAGASAMLGTSMQHEVRANHGERAYYLAESGFRYVASIYRSEGKEAVEALPVEHQVEAPSGGRFTITELAVKEGGDNMFTVASGQTVNEGEDLTISVIDPNAMLPINGAFQIGGKYYRYLYYTGGTKLENIICLKDCSFPVPEGTARTVDSIELKIKGEYPGSGPLNAARTITYWWPLSGSGEGGEGETETVIVGEEAKAWVEGSGKALGTFRYDNTEKAIMVRDVQSGHSVASLMFELPDGGSGIDSADYDAQVKIKLAAMDQLTPVKDYMAGITFRQRGTHQNVANFQAYGISFLRLEPVADPSGLKRLPKEIVPNPQSGKPAIVLWKGDDLNHALTRLAWAPIDPASGIVDANGHLKEWATLLVTVEELGEPGAKYNRIRVMYGDAGDSITGNNLFYDDQRKSSRRLFSQPEGARLPWPPRDLGDWTAEKDHFTVVQWQESTGGGATRHNHDDKQVFIHTAAGEYLFLPGGELEVGLHAFGENLQCERQGSHPCTVIKIWFDDFAIRIGEGGGEGLPDYVPPIQR